MLSADAALDEEGGDGEGDDAPNPFQHFADDVTLFFEEFEHGVDVVFDDVNDVWCRRMPGFLFTFAKVRHSRRAFSVFCTFVHHRVALFLFFFTRSVRIDAEPVAYPADDVWRQELHVACHAECLQLFLVGTAPFAQGAYRDAGTKGQLLFCHCFHCLSNYILTEIGVVFY